MRSLSFLRPLRVSPTDKPRQPLCSIRTRVINMLHHHHHHHCHHHHHHPYHHHHLYLNGEGRCGTTDDFATSFLHFPLFSTILWDLPNSRPVHSRMLCSHLFLCLPCLLPPFTVPCKMVWARPNERETDHTTAVCVSLQWPGGLLWSDCLLDLGTDFLVGNMVFV